MKNKAIAVISIIMLSVAVIFLFPFIRNVKSKDNKIEAILTFEHTFEKCGHTETYTPDNTETFEDISEITLLYPSWQIKTADEGRIYLIKTSEGYCKNHYKAHLRGNKITVTRLNDNTVYKEFYISLKYLTEDDINELKNGKAINSRQELTEFTEDFTS
ncbi:MAG: hypothetical protein J6A69_08785 [Clostridia bacterium]|nr:hypothetical protein [Clostridia bacterium]